MKDFSLYPQKNNSNSDQDNQVSIVLTRRSIIRLISFAISILTIILLIWLIPFVKSLLAPLAISLVLSLLLTPLVNEMENQGINRGPAIVIIFLIFGSIIVIGFKLLIPSLSHEIQSLSQAIENENPQSLIEKLQITFTQRIPVLKNPQIAHEVSIKLHDFFTSLIQKSLNIILSIISSFTMFVTVPFITFFLLKDGQRIKKFIIQCVPNRYFEMSLNLLYKINLQLGNYIRGQLLVSSIIATLSIIALYSLNVPYFFIIGIIAGLANMIPYFGPIVGALPAILVAIVETGSLGPVLGIIIAFAMIQLLDNVLISPVIVSKSVQIHPLLVIIVILIGSNLGGIFGMLVAVPLFAVAQVIIKEIIWSFKHYRLTG